MPPSGGFTDRLQTASDLYWRRRRGLFRHASGTETSGSVMTVPLLRRQWPSKRASSPVARVSEVGSAQGSALRGDDPVADTPAIVVASQGVKMRHACERPVRHEHE